MKNKNKYTKDDYFAAASAHDLWGCWFIGIETPINRKNTLDVCKAKDGVYGVLFKEGLEIVKNNLPLENWYPDFSFIAAQLGCEKAGLC